MVTKSRVEAIVRKARKHKAIMHKLEKEASKLLFQLDKERGNDINYKHPESYYRAIERKLDTALNILNTL